MFSRVLETLRGNMKGRLYSTASAISYDTGIT